MATLSIRRIEAMVRRMGSWLQLLEAGVIITVLLVIAWLALQALSEAYGPLFHILNRF